MKVKQAEKENLKRIIKLNPSFQKYLDLLEESFKLEEEKYFNYYQEKHTKHFTHILKYNNSTTYRELEVFFKERFGKNYTQNEVVQDMRNLFITHPTTVFKFPLSPNPNHKELLVEMAKKNVEELKTNLLQVAYEKISFIGKNIQRVEKVYLRNSFKGFEGEFKFSFTDGTSFIIRTQAVFAQGMIQRPHYRYLSHFVDVDFGNGVIKSSATEEEMVRFFGNEEVKEQFKHNNVAEMSEEEFLALPVKYKNRRKMFIRDVYAVVNPNYQVCLGEARRYGNLTPEELLKMKKETYRSIVKK